MKLPTMTRPKLRRKPYKPKNLKPYFIALVPLLLLLAALAYARPVDIYTLAPDLEPQSLFVILQRHTGDAANVSQRTLALSAQDGGDHQTALTQIESLRFHRLPFGGAIQSMRDNQSQTAAEGDFQTTISLGDGEDDLQLRGFLGKWSYVTFTGQDPAFRAVLLSGGQKAGDALSVALWDMAE